MDWVKKVCNLVTVPFIIGGGITNVEDMKELLELGVDKVSINTAAFRDPELIHKASIELGKDKLVVAIDGKKNPPSNGLPRLEVVVKSGSESTGMSVIDWARKVEDLGAGEILLTSKDADGTKDGYDLEMTRAVSEAVTIPVIASGSAGTLEHFYQAVTIGKASAVLAASVFHFRELTINQTKSYLKERGVHVRE